MLNTQGSVSNNNISNNILNTIEVIDYLHKWNYLDKC